MKSHRIRFAALLSLILLITAVPAFAGIFENALANCGLSFADIRIDEDELAFRGENTRHLIPLLDSCRRNPFKMGRYCRTAAHGAAQSADSMRSLITAAALRTGNGQYRGWLESPLTTWTSGTLDYEALDRELIQMSAKYSGKWASRYIKDTMKSWEKVPTEVVQCVIVFLRALDSAMQWRDNAFKKLPEGDREVLYKRYLADLTKIVEEKVEFPKQERHVSDDVGELIGMLDSIDWRMLYTGALELAIAVEHMRAKLSGIKFTATYAVSLETPLGNIALGGVGENFYSDGGPYLLIIDIGGNDNYRTGGASHSYAKPVGVILDMDGNDIYTCETIDKPCFGAGIFGYGYLYDVAGNDFYKAMTVSQGAGLFGVGGLWDGAGDDTYSNVNFGQAAGYYGVGVLADLAGSDKYKSYHLSQAFAGPLSGAILLDLKGNDSYTAVDTDVRFPSPQSKEHNSSLCQGVGFGRRADYLDGHSLGGGFALLADMAGDDLYSGGVFAQGVGYWGGVGMLYDGGGNDGYRGVWYVMGATAHFAASAFVDESGDDLYVADMNMAMGAGHDYSVSYFLDAAGNDIYTAPNLSLGAGNANGIGIFIDLSGSDIYNCKGISLGGAAIEVTSPALSRYFSLSLGVFLDAAGRDTYNLDKLSPKTLAPADGCTWLHKRSDKASPYEKGIGIDSDEPLKIPEL